MKNDKFLIGIIIGIVALVVAAVIIVLSRAQTEIYIADDSPAGVVHNYFLAVQQEDYDKAYGYLSDAMKNKPDLDDFILNVDNLNNQEASLQLNETKITADRAQVKIAVTTYSGGAVFERNSYTNRDTVHLRQNAAGNWQIFQFPYPYWGYDWNEEPVTE
jgi:hypothetical protein